MAAQLESQLDELCLCLSETGKAECVKAQDIISNIYQICQHDVSDKDIDYCCTLLFRKDGGIISFLKKVIQDDEFQHCKADALRIFLALTAKYDKKLVPYSVDLKDLCMSLFMRDRFAKVKSAAICLLVEVVRITAGSVMAHELNIGALVEKMFTELVHTSKYVSTVKQRIYHLLGVIAEMYPELMINYSDRLVDMYVRTIKTQMTSKTKKPDLPLIVGSLQGLNHLLVQFTQSADEGAKYSYDIYKYTCLAMSKEVNEKVSRYEMAESALTLLAKHASQFSQYLLDDYQKRYEQLAFWCNHHNRDMMHLGLSAMEAFLKQVSTHLVSLAKAGRKEESVFAYFIREFRRIMDDPDSSSKQISLAVRGYGYFAAPCRLFLSQDDVKYMFTEMAQRSEHMFVSQSDDLEDRIIGLPHFIEALASIITELDEISSSLLLLVEKLILLLMENFPKLPEKMHFVCFLAILKLCFSLAPKGAVFKEFLSRIVYQGLLRTCSHPIVTKTTDNEANELNPENRIKTITYKDYITMWRTLLTCSGVKGLGSLDITVDQIQAFTTALYDELITSILHLLDRLDLTYSTTGGDEDTHSGTDGITSSDPVKDQHPTKPKDFIIFVNVVDFCNDLLPNVHRNLFDRWIYRFGHQLIVYSTMFPLISGFYKLLSVCMNIASKTNYFKALGNLPKVDADIEQDQDVEDMITDEPVYNVLSHREACFLLFCKYTKEVLVRLKQYKDDLLASCLFFILSLPCEVVNTDLSAIVPALQLALQLGYSYLPIANAALDALDTWSQKLPDGDMRPHYRDILQYLDPYLRSSNDMVGSDDSVDQTVMLSSVKSKHKSARKTVSFKVLKHKVKQTDDINVESQLTQVRQRCVLLLGSLGGAINNVLVTCNADELAKAAVAWDRVKHLKFDLPFVDIKPVIYFDAFLPRVIELSTKSSERQTKVAACELLHSLVLYMLGRSSQQPGTRHAEHADGMEVLYKKIFPALMQLACDVEQVAQQLFEPLVMQLIHWFTSAVMYKNKCTQVLLETIMDGLVHPTDSALRDFSARCVHEFLQWSIKQTTKKQRAESPYNVKMLLSQIYVLARHPSAFKRLGASLAFNNIYMIFREEDILIDMFTFEILVTFVESLAIAHHDDKSLGTQEQTKKVLTHLERIISKKSDLLCQPSKIRKKPKDWNDATLQICLRWLLRQVGRPQNECRHACMQLVYNLATSLPGIKTPADLFTALVKDDSKYFLQRFEFGIYSVKHGKQGIGKRPRMTDMQDEFTLKAALTWFDLLLCTLDCYTWVFGAGLLNPTMTLSVQGSKGTAVFKVLEYFFDKLAQGGIEKAAGLFEKSQYQIFTPREREDYNRIKCTVIVRVMDFIVTLLKNFKQDSLEVIPATFWSTSLWQTIATCILMPADLGFNMADVEILENLPKQTQQLLIVLKSNLPEKIISGFTATLHNMIQNQRCTELFHQLPATLDDNKPTDLQLSQLVKGYQQLHQAGLLELALGHGKDIHALAIKLLDAVFEGIVTSVDGESSLITLTPTSADLASEMLKLAFHFKLQNEELISRLLNKSLIKSMAAHSSSAHGTMFYACFKSTINCQLVTNCEEFLGHLLCHASSDANTVGCILTGMVEYVRQDRQLRKKYGHKVITTLLEKWPTLRCWWQGDTATNGTQNTALVLLKKMMLIDSTVVCDVQQNGFSDVFDMYVYLLVNKNVSLTFKSHALDLLAFFCSLPTDYLHKLKTSLDRFVDDNFPHQSTEYKRGSPKFSEYITAFNKILSALELSGSLMLLELLISVICKEETHVHEEEIQSVLSKMAHRLPIDKQKAAVDVAYNVFCKEGSFKNLQRRAALERVCLTVLRSVSIPALKEFFCDHIKDIMSRIEVKFNKNSESVFETQLVTRLCNLLLLEVMYSRLTREDVRSKNSVINQKYCSPKVDVDGKEMTAMVIKVANDAKREDMQGETLLLELRRQYHCAAYNTLIAVVTCTQTELKFYNGFLFMENLDKHEFLWDNLVDQNKEYDFPVELQNPLARRKKFVAIRSEHKESQSAVSGANVSSVRYLTSQYLADSSLMADVSQYDFTASVQASVLPGSLSSYEHSSEGDSDHGQSLGETDSDVINTDITIQGDYVEMEMDELNQHECMAPLISVIKHMSRNNITPPVAKGEAPTALPIWMENIRKKLQNPYTKRNVRLFLVKLIINTEEVFRPYARFWYAPLVHVITSKDLGATGINYMISDLTATLLSWHSVAIPEDTSIDRAMASQLLKVLMINCHHDSQQVLKNNLELLKTLVEVWKPRLEIPTRILYDNFTVSDMKSKRNMTGIQMTGVILANNLSPHTPGCDVSKDDFYNCLAKNMQHTSKAVYMSAAEVTGMALKYMTESEIDEEHVRWHKQYIDFTSSLLKDFQSSKPDQFINCIYGMQLHFPAIADGILFILPNVHGEFKTNCLEILQSRISRIDNAFLEMKNKDITGILAHRDDASQLAALKLVKGLCSRLKPSELLYLLPTITAFTSHRSASCRSVMYDILMWIYDNYRDEEGNDVTRIMISVKEALLFGLSDKHIKNRLMIENFWSHPSRLPSNTVDRLVTILEAMYSPASEHHYLAYATNLLLEMTSRSPDYKRHIFEHPLSECTFKDYHVKHSWQQRHSTMTPLFVDTQSSQHLAGSSPSEQSISSIKVRATQDVQQFTATQDMGMPKAPYNWLTQSSLDTFADIDLTTTTETQSSLLFTIGSTKQNQGTGEASKPSHRGRLGQRPGPGFGKEQLSSDKTESDKDVAAGPDILHLKRRFIKDSKAKRAYFAKREARLRAMRLEIVREQRQKRENQVTMYRKYRIGDLPDIQIEYSSVIAPLQALAQKDTTIARLLLSTIFKAIYTELDKVKTESELDDLNKRISKGLNDMLSTTSQFSAPFINCIMDIALCNTSNLTLEPEYITNACMTSLQQPVGITLLETMLIHAQMPNGSSRKRPRIAGPQISREISVWLELAKLFKSIGDFDVLKGIFASRLGTQDITSKAMDAEMSGDYQTAVKLYSEALGCTEWDEEPNELEKDLWDVGRLQCYEHLTQWNRLVECTVSSIDDNKPPQLEKIWEDSYHQDTYLPYLIRSKLKLLFEHGDGQDDLAAFIDSAMKIPERKALLENRFSEELALLHIWQEDYDRAMYHTDHAIQLFLQNWTNVNYLMSSSRTQHLQMLQKLTEMQEFLSFIRKGDNFNSQSAVVLQTKKWMRRSPDPVMDPSIIWDDVMSNRIVYLDQLAQHLQEDSSHSWVEQQKVKLRLSQAKAARQQNNFPVALKQMKTILTDLIKPVPNKAVLTECYHEYTRIHQRKCQVLPMTDSEKVKALTDTIDTLKKKCCDVEDTNLKCSQCMLQGEAIFHIARILQKSESLPEMFREKLLDMAQCSIYDHDKVLASLAEEGYKHLKIAVSVTCDDTSGNSDLSIVNAAHMSLVNYCDHYLRQMEDSSLERAPCSLSSFPTAVIVSLLAAMANGSNEAKQRFPRLLQLVEHYPDTVSTFISKASGVPTWMFLSWISQITALLDKPESPAVQDLLIRLATSYPQAVVYPFKMSCDGYQFSDDQQGQNVMKILKGLLSKNPLTDQFVNALEQFGEPAAIFRDWFTDHNLWNYLSKPHKNKVHIKSLYQRIYDQLVINDKITFGPYRTRFAKKYGREIVDKFGTDGEKLLEYTPNKFRNVASMLFKKIGEFQNPVDKISEYSEWLSTFQGCEMDEEIEIPGQYTGNKKPLPEYHVKISSFQPVVKVMASMRKPKRIVINGNDQKEYPFLVKSGEDLRLDQRIEQLFDLMNEVFIQDPNCHRRKLQLRTYQVIPMTTRVGLIEWMKNTQPLKEFLYQSFTEAEKKSYLSQNGPRHQYALWLGVTDNMLSSYHPYQNSYMKHTRSDAITHFKSRENLVPWNLLLRAYQNMAASPEAFFTLKNCFAVSHGQICICHYMLGIGDRHLSNFMVDLQNGKMVGIDFGHAFGSATEFLPVPELMPFRLTCQLRNLMLPQREKGLLECTMIHTLRALRNNADILLNTMDVFIKEPSLDWKQNAAKQTKERNLNEDDFEDEKSDQAWYPREKIAFARRKFDGHNPAYITRDELKLGHSKKTYYRKAEQVILGDSKEDIRAKLPAKDLTVEQQVACLLNQATDGNILCRAYVGWEAWM